MNEPHKQGIQSSQCKLKHKHLSRIHTGILMVQISELNLWGPTSKQLDDQVPPVPLSSSLPKDSTGFRQLKFRHIVDDNTDSVSKGSRNCRGIHMPKTDLADLPSSGQMAKQQTSLLRAV